MMPTAPDRPQPLFRRIRRAWADAPAVVQVLVVAVVIFVWLTAFGIGQPSDDPGSIVFRGVVAVLLGSVRVGALWIRRLSWPGAPREVEVSEAAEDGELPAGADLVVWRDALERRRREIRHDAWVLPITLLLFVGLAFLPRSRPFGASDAAFLILLAVFATYAASLIVSRALRRDRVDALLIPLQEQVRRDEERRAAWAPPTPEDRIPPAAG
ncbi:hypothetical protein ACR8AL_04695 [Clavibacter sepedonicus]|uniref:Integral membrane protein n=2 Tax=Clavibacter sepedonicus TaxID=31964 RepID=B0RI00_CLASE|nr:hypothetical protein [Clavibacter sp.]MBD5381634.1 hypothetical protein [Clavibacter sp.]CAQ01427.1 putative integral membrane protein [Clavibacter sepedonicus]